MSVFGKFCSRGKLMISVEKFFLNILVMIYNEVLSYQQDQQAKLKSVPTTTSTTASSQNAQVDSNGNSKSKLYCYIQLSCKSCRQMLLLILSSFERIN